MALIRHSTSGLPILWVFVIENNMQLRRADTALTDDTDVATTTYNDKYVVVYDFADVGSSAFFPLDKTITDRIRG